jgi:CubicO group peptidase (beta-lactamase class C family)
MLEKKIDELIKKTKIDFNGTITINRKGKCLYSKAFGYADLEHGIENRLDTKFRIGSLTKQFTAAAVLMLNEAGSLSLNQTLDMYIPDYPRGNEVTIHHLLTHSSGIFNYTNIDDFEEIMIKPHSPLELIETFKYLPLMFDPGSKHDYSNSGYAVLGYIIEMASGLTYKAYLQNHIFTPLKMLSTGYDDYMSIIKFRAKGYETDEKTKELKNASYIDLSVPYAAGALYSTGNDMMTWHKALHSGRVLSEESLKLMMTPYTYDGDEYYGYGFYLVLDEAKNLVRVSHDGGIDGFLSNYRYLINQDLQIVLLTNEINDTFWSLCDKVEEIVSKEFEINK